METGQFDDEVVVDVVPEQQAQDSLCDRPLEGWCAGELVDG